MPGDVKIGLEGAAKVLETAIGSLKTFAEGLRDAVKAGFEVMDIASARKAEKHLRVVLSQANDLVTRQGILFLPAKEGEIRLPDGPRWRKLREDLRDVLQRVEAMLADLRADRSKFVAHESHLLLLETLAARKAALEEILAMEEPPSTSEEVERFRAFVTRYVNLIAQLRQVSMALAAYIQAKE